jgi:MFS family permease
MTSTSAATQAQRPTYIRYGVLAFACSLAMITYLDRVCFGTIVPYMQADFGFDDEQKGALFTAFALAYAVFEVPTGWLGDVFGPRKTLIRIVLWWSVFTALTGSIYPTPSYPWIAFGALLLVRFLFGVGEAGAFPNIAKAQSNWFPFTERAFGQGAVWMSGRFGGGVTPLVISMLIITQSTDTGQTTQWRHLFWIFGVTGAIWCIAFWWWFRDRPEQNPSVNAAELALIHRGGDLKSAGHAQVPWGKLFTNRNLWFICVMYFCGSYGWYFNITWLPSYLGQMYSVTKETPGFSLMAGLPLLLGSTACLIGGLLSDFIIRRTGSQKWGRRFCGVLGHGLCALFWLSAAFMDTAWSFVWMAAIATFWNDMTMGASWASCLDIGGKYAGIVSGCMNTIGNLGGATAGYSTAWILKRYSSPDAGWHANFLLFAGIYAIATFMWCLFDSTKPVFPPSEPETAPA